jgi:hypothetical protein
MAVPLPTDSDVERVGGPIIIKGRSPTTDERSVMVINTGGTIGMKLNALGALESCPGFLALRMADMHELQRADVPSLTLFELLPLLDSSNMGPREWVRIAELIAAHYFEFDAFVVVMGTVCGFQDASFFLCHDGTCFLFGTINAGHHGVRRIGVVVYLGKSRQVCHSDWLDAAVVRFV